MIGLVVVSHSRRLAEGVAELAAEMGGEGLRLRTAGGLDQPGAPLGTDAALVAKAIDEVWSDDGVLVLMDLGSAVLSAELAVDLLPKDRRGRVLLTEAPLVEGAVAAAVAAGLGASLEEAASEARAGLTAKAEHLAPGHGEPCEERDAGAPALSRPGAKEAPPEASAAPTLTLDLRVRVGPRHGLHARPAAALVRTAAAYDAEVTVADVTAGRGPVSARSLNAVATLGARQGHELLFRASGPAAEQALAALQRLTDEGFGDPAELSATCAAAPGPGPGPGPAAAPSVEPGGMTPALSTAAQRPVTAPAPGSTLQGLAVSPGLAVGEARALHPAPLRLPTGPSTDPGADWAALRQALDATAREIHGSRASVAATGGAYEAGIFDAHELFLTDETLLGPAREAILERRVNAAHAWAEAVATAAAAWDELDDPYLRGRVADLRAVGEQVLRHLVGDPAAPALSGAGIVLADDLTPAQTAGLDRSLVRGLACASGAPTSHSSILARSLGIPAVVGLAPELLAIQDGTMLALDGDAGTLTVEPTAPVRDEARRRAAAREREDAAARERAGEPAVTADGVTVRVEANVATPSDVPAALQAGADGVGLLRTEFLFLESDHLPGEDEQEAAYRAAAQALRGRPLTLRTLDVGADKQLPGLPLGHEQNPFLGVRGLRLSLRRPDLLRTQLRAALRVAADHPLRIMFPMVATVDELLQARDAVDRARAFLVGEGAPVPEHLEVGIMVEVPAAALLVDLFVPHADFFSLGTNDLAQYTLAAERGNAGVAALADALHPSVLWLIERTARAAAAAGRRAAVCGEIAGDALATPLLLGLGATELSMAAVRIPAVKQAVRATRLTEARDLARRALAAESAAAVRTLCRGARP